MNIVGFGRIVLLSVQDLSSWIGFEFFGRITFCIILYLGELKKIIDLLNADFCRLLFYSDCK